MAAKHDPNYYREDQEEEKGDGDQEEEKVSEVQVVNGSYNNRRGDDVQIQINFNVKNRNG